MQSINIIRLLALIGLLGFGFCLAETDLAQQQEQQNENELTEWAVDAKIDDGRTIKYPYFDNNVKEIDENLRLLHIKQMQEILDYVTKVVGNELDKPGSTGFLGWLKVGKNMVSMGYSHRAERLKLKTPYLKDKEFNTSMSNMFKGLMVRSKERATTMTKESNEDLRKRVVAYTHQLKKAIEISKVGPYIKMEDGLIDGEKFTDVTVDVMASLRNNGFEKFLGAIDSLMSIIAMFK